jgi:hypothetical protein
MTSLCITDIDTFTADPFEGVESDWSTGCFLTPPRGERDGENGLRKVET